MVTIDDIINSPTKFQQIMDFAVPSALSTDTTGTDDLTAISQFVLAQPNFLVDIVNSPDPASGLNYTLYTKRADNVKRLVGATQNFLQAFNGRVRPRFPAHVNAGTLLWIEQQTLGTLTKQSYVMTWATPLII